MTFATLRKSSTCATPTGTGECTHRVVARLLPPRYRCCGPWLDRAVHLGGKMIKKIVATVAATGGLVLAGAGLASADAGAQGAAVGSPGVLSGNVVQVPVHVPVNLCGNTISVIGLLNPAFGNTCVNA
ncbi:membrane protein [Streptomyces sp. SPB074]|nr:membrane protein [Streptomyces sp. SPB074]